VGERGRGVGAGRTLPRPGSSVLDPGDEVLDHGIGKRAVWRHLELVERAANGLDEQAFVRIAGNDGRAAVTPFKQRGP
jgi:hypothetical protein